MNTVIMMPAFISKLGRFHIGFKFHRPNEYNENSKANK